MENKTSYTLTQAKNDLAKEYGYETWWDIDYREYSEESLRDEAAELYKEKATEELRKENEALKSLLIESEGVRDKTVLILKTQTITNCKAEIERLTQSNKELVDTVSILGEEICNLKETKEQNMENTLNPSESVFGFCAWLTTRKDVTKMSSSNDCAPIVELIKDFIKTNNLPEIRENWTDFLTHPDGNINKSKP